MTPSWYLEHPGDGENGSGLVWIHLDGRNPDDMAWLTNKTVLPPAARSALAAIETRPRCQPMGHGALINLRGIGLPADGEGDPLVSIRLWAEQGKVISLSYRRLDEFEQLRIAMEKGLLRDPGDLIAAIAASITRKLDPVVAALGDDIDDCEVALIPENAFKLRSAIAVARSEAIGYRRFVVPQRQALEQMANLDAEWLEPEDRLHLHEAADRFARMAEELEAIRERSALMHEQLTDMRAEMMDRRTLILSIVALVFLPLTFLSGLLGMNVAGIPFADQPWAFWGVIGVCVGVAIAITAYFARADWFRG